MAEQEKYSMVKSIRQSPPVDLSIPYDSAWLKNKTILITGGASGFGAAFVRKWAANGACVIIGDISVQKADQLARDVRKETSNPRVHFVYCDVTDWQSQVNLFKEAVKRSPHGGIDCVIACAGVAGTDTLQTPSGLDALAPSKPDFKVIDVNITGVLYTTHLAFFYLPRNPGSTDCSPDSDPANTPRDRHVLLIGSVAGLMPLTIQPQYCASKHAVLGLFRSLRSSAFASGVRVNLLCPYFIDTPILPTSARVMLAGGGTGKVEDVVDAGTRLVADSRIVGRSLYVGPKVKVRQRDDGELVLDEGGEDRAVWEAYADDWEDAELFCRRMIRILNTITQVKGWTGWFKDMFAALLYGIGR
ncbi:hypothetical protein W97_06966 [Coniosporium apollinis CBS 100218]|uniref:Uncharacterized protein n=1 Tax=Coniosporium apollinis (strain CBS 100218) TaxID=1168221 RepID=R7Z0L3_CONA1|nr:uncharacterized protein W97_06966 [Coniosporium apollinis CBS 100218]EON67598.1 hypothetical protein W97_06966 [Coniosporium apollinis CBS 100218]